MIFNYIEKAGVTFGRNWAFENFPTGMYTISTQIGYVIFYGLAQKFSFFTLEIYFFLIHDLKFYI